jgi:hypothetical protein
VYCFVFDGEGVGVVDCQVYLYILFYVVGVEVYEDVAVWHKFEDEVPGAFGFQGLVVGQSRLQSQVYLLGGDDEGEMDAFSLEFLPFIHFDSEPQMLDIFLGECDESVGGQLCVPLIRGIGSFFVDD